jgi:hypothetical protein
MMEVGNVSLTKLFDEASELIEDPVLVAASLRPFVERACKQQPNSVLLKEIREFVAQGMVTCSQSQLHSIAYHLNGDQLFMIEDHVPEHRVAPAAPTIRPAPLISDKEQDDFIRELEQFTI